jgi:YegS/Rv2252/BmrU family lipid kinase
MATGDAVRDEPIAGAMPQTDGERLVVLNPTSGSADHADRVRGIAAERGYRVEETEREGHATEIARAAAATEDLTLVAVAGGDGTVHEVVRGLHEAEALDRTTLAVLPVGTKNIFASHLGIRDAGHGFDVVETGARRRIDLGMADDEPFVISCIAGLTADASVATSDELKERFGSLAFLVAGVREATSFESFHVDVTAVSNGEETTWSGDALGALVGNVRQFAKQGGQADVEDGLFDVVLVEEMPTSDVVAEAVAQRVLGQSTEHVVHLRATQLEIERLDGGTLDFSIDGEPISHDALTLYNRRRTLRVCVGPEYEAPT